MLHGREQELDDLCRLIARAGTGRSAALLLRGAPGSGKSALLDEAVELAAESALVLRGVGVESESELPFAAMQLLLRPVQAGIDGLPEPQAVALRRALGLASTGTADRFLVGLAVLTLLSDLAEARPVLCVVDDAQWVDRASAEALLFVARRLLEEGVVLLLGAREDFDPPGIPHRTLDGLDRRAALALLAERRPGLAPQIRDRIVAEASGNPLALIELPSAHGAPVGPLPLPRRLQQAYESDISVLPDPTRLLLLIVAAEESGDLSTVLPAASALGLSPAAITPAERAGLLAVSGDVVRFRHPLMRAAAYNGLPLEHRLAVHQVLADQLSDDRRAWHLAAAATGPNEQVAAELQAAAERAERRGGHTAAVVAYERAAELSTDESARAARLAAAAFAASSAGHLEQAAERAESADKLSAEPAVRARLAMIRADAAVESGLAKRAYVLLLDAVGMLAGTDPEVAAGMLLASIRIACFGGVAMDEAAALTNELALAATHPMQPLLALARNVAGWKVDGVVVEPPPFHAAVKAQETMPGGLCSRLEVAYLIDRAYGRVDSADIAVALVAECRSQGVVGLLPQALLLLAMVELSLNRWRAGYAHADEAMRIAADTGREHTTSWLRVTMAWAAAITGDEERAVLLAEQSLRDEPVLGIGAVGRQARRVLCLLDIGFGRYAAALDRMDSMVGQSPALDRRLAPERIEAATRLGELSRAGSLADLADPGGHPVETAVALRCQAMLADSAAETDRLFRSALDADTVMIWPFEHARTELLYGEWLRRVRRKADARVHLRIALEGFERMGARPWADRARRELRASGDSLARAAAAHTSERLTPQELQVARLAITGLTNREIAAQLFLSPKTVGHHLYRAFPKLGVTTRTELARLDLD